jgi:DNA-binding MarR family transcriptional regulator
LALMNRGARLDEVIHTVTPPARLMERIAQCTRTHKSTISRAVTALMERQLVERVENADDRREFRLRMTRKGKALYEELIPRLLRKEQEILSCLSAQERKDFAALLTKIEQSFELIQTSEAADAKEAY